MNTHDIVVIGASAGGVEAVLELTSHLPEDFAAAIFIAIHFPASSQSRLPEIITRNSALTAVHPTHGEKIRGGRIYVAPPDRHMLIAPGMILLSTGPREHGSRPAIDPLFRSAARSYGNRTIGIILSGTRQDGTAGLVEIASHGGLSIVQDPEEAKFSSMPNSAILQDHVDYILPVSEITPIVEQATQGAQCLRSGTVIEASPSAGQEPEVGVISDQQAATLLTCPECGAPIWKITKGVISSFRCSIGHVYSDESLQEAQSLAIENVLWKAVHLLEERVILLGEIEQGFEASGLTTDAERCRELADQTKKNAETIISIILSASSA
jgi:two-component system chemotaxis response regulator CheB